MAKAAGRSSASATSAEASTQSSQVALVAGERDAGLLEERGVGEAAGQRELGHEAGDGLASRRGASSRACRRSWCASSRGRRDRGVRSSQWSACSLRLVTRAMSGPWPACELDRQLLLDHLVGDVVEDDVDAGVLGHEALEQVLDHGALDAVGVPHHAHVAGAGRRPAPPAPARPPSSQLVSSSHPPLCRPGSVPAVVHPMPAFGPISRRVPAIVQSAGSSRRPSAVTVPSGSNSTTP